MKKSGFLLVIAALLMIIPVSHSYAVYDVNCSFTGANLTVVETCLHSFQQYQKMNQETANTLEKITEQHRMDLQHNYVNQNITQFNNWVNSKTTLSKQMAYSDTIKRAWYDYMMADNTKQINTKINYWKTYDHTPKIMPVSCPAWHICGADNIPLDFSHLQNEPKVKQNFTSNMSSITLKPEFKNNTSGYINNTSGIKTWQDYDNWYVKNMTKTSIK